MDTQQKILIMVILGLLVSACYVSLDFKATADVPPEYLTVTLNAPANGTVLSPTYTSDSWSFDAEFSYIPTIYGSDIFQNASLIVNGTVVSVTNQTEIVNNTANFLYYRVSTNGVYIWNVQVCNSTMAVNSTDNLVLVMNTVVETPTPTETPATPTPTMPISTSTPTPTPTATAKPKSLAFDTLTVVVIVVVLAVVIGVTAYLLLKRK
jgi:hypothetical protein